jgi:hypothetical protein
MIAFSLFMRNRVGHTESREITDIAPENAKWNKRSADSNKTA